MCCALATSSRYIQRFKFLNLKLLRLKQFRSAAHDPHLLDELPEEMLVVFIFLPYSYASISLLMVGSQSVVYHASIYGFVVANDQTLPT